MRNVNDRIPNYRKQDGRLVLLRCYACADPKRGVENYIHAAYMGQCAWCGWRESFPEEGDPNCDTE